MQRQMGDQAVRAEATADREPTAWDDAHTEMAHLQATIDRLLDRLEPVLRPLPPVATLENPVSAAELSGLAVHVETLRLSRLRLEGLISRLDL